jgi:hypothetical protein
MRQPVMHCPMLVIVSINRLRRRKLRAALFAAYTERVLNRRGARTPYTPGQTIRWLRWLARRMRARNQSIFLIEQLQPEWLTDPQHVRQYVLSDRLG